jgi:Family of unknown function (DUF6116)
MANPLLTPILGFASRLRFPTLFKIVAALFIIDLVTPDLIPFLTFGMPFDEVLMAALTLLLASWKGRDEKSETNGTSAEKPPIEGEFKKE